MAEVIQISSSDKDDYGIYKLFQDELTITKNEGKALFLFQGHDWCPDCPPAVRALEELARNYNGDVSLCSVYVGTKDQWRKVRMSERENAFIVNSPHLQAIPTVALYVGLPRTEISLLANLTTLPDSQDYREHLKILEDILSLAGKYSSLK